MKKSSVLIVEDEAVVAAGLESNLMRLGYMVTTIADNGEQAIAAAEETRPDIVLMDIRIKGNMDGIKTAEIIRSRTGIPIIFCSAYLDKDRIERAKLTMPFGYVLKPIQIRDLKITMEMALYVAAVDRRRCEVESELEDSRGRLQMMLECTGDIIFIVSREGRILDCNRAAEERLDLHKDQIKGSSPGQFIPDQIAAQRDLLLKRVFETGRELQFSDQRGGRFFQHRFLPIRDIHGDVTAAIVYSRDCTEAARLESEKEALIEMGSDMMLVLDPDGTVVTANTNWIEKTGWKKDDLYLVPAHEFIHVEEQAVFQSVFSDIIHLRKKCADLACRVRYAEDEYHSISLRLFRPVNSPAIYLAARPEEIGVKSGSTAEDSQ